MLFPIGQHYKREVLKGQYTSNCNQSHSELRGRVTWIHVTVHNNTGAPAQTGVKPVRGTNSWSGADWLHQTVAGG